jgi:calcineurin-like phosphoesterase family protein
MWYICSDTHLGVAGSRKDFFGRLLGQVKEGDTLVLLGDIFDYWISALSKDRRDSLDNLVDSWNWLLDKLQIIKELKEQVNIIYIPGNHDTFVFFNEWAYSTTNPPWWLSRLYSGNGLFKEISRKTTESRPISSVASIHYPFYKTTLGNKNILFTHGHWTDGIWSIVTGGFQDPLLSEPKLPFIGEAWPILKATFLSFFYENPGTARRLYLAVRGFRQSARFFNPVRIMKSFFSKDSPISLDPLKDEQAVEDLMYFIVSDVIVFKTRYAMEINDFTPEKLDRIDRNIREKARLTAEIFENYNQYSKENLRQYLMEISGSSQSEVERGIQRGKEAMAKWNHESSVKRQLDYFEARLNQFLNFPVWNYEISPINKNENPKVSSQPFFDKSLKHIIHGHFHIPRNMGMFIDDGCIFEETKYKLIATAVKIDDEGNIFGPNSM